VETRIARAHPPSARRALLALAVSSAIVVLAVLDTRGTEESAEAARSRTGHSGSESCFACHRGMVHEMAGLKHAPLMDETRFRGCEECHGPGLAHVEAMGARGTILSQKAGSDARAANAACVACHAFDAGQAGCFERLERGLGPLCASCHRVHPGTGRIDPASVAPGLSPESDESRARSRFRGPTAGKPEDLPKREEEPAKALEIAGELTAGWRFVDDDGRQYRQDVNQDGGPRLLDFRLDGRLLAEKSLFDRFSVEASGVDDPYSSYRGTVEKDGRVKLEAAFRKWDNVYVSGGDPHQYFVRRERFDASAKIALSDETDLTLAYSRTERSGRANLSRYVLDDQNDLFPDAPERVDQVTHVADAALEFPLGTVFHGVVRQSLVVHENDDSRTFAEPIAEFPFVEFERFRSEARTITPQTLVKVVGDPIEDVLRLEAGALVSNAETDVDVFSEDGGIDENLDPFGKTTDGDGSVSRSTEAFFLAASLRAADPLTLAARYDLRLEDDDGDLLLADAYDDGRTRVFADDTKVRTRTHRLAGDVLYDAADWLGLRAGYEFFAADVEVSHDPDPDARTRGGGPYVGADVRPSKRFSAKALVRTFDLRDPYTDISPEDDDSAKLSLEWKPRDDFRLGGDAKYRVQRSRYLIVLDGSDGGARFETATAGTTATFSALESLDVHAGYAWQSVHSEADAVFFFDFEPALGAAVFSGDSHSGSLGVAWRLSDDSRLTFDASGVTADGDYSYDLLDLVARAEHDLREDLTLSGEIRRITFDESARNDNDYTAWIGLVAVTWRF